MQIKKNIGWKTNDEGTRSRTGYANIAGDSDDQGLSLGVLQWNIGQGTLQPLLKEYFIENPEDAKLIFGSDYKTIKNAIYGSLDDQMSWVKSINDDKGRINGIWRKQLVALCNTNEFQEIQNKAMKPYVNKAVSICNKYNLESEMGFALAFDIAVQNGGIKNKTGQLIKQQIGGKTLREDKILSIIANAVADNCRTKYYDDVLSRKMTIVNGLGTVHGKKYNLNNNYDLTNKILQRRKWGINNEG